MSKQLTGLPFNSIDTLVGVFPTVCSSHSPFSQMQVTFCPSQVSVHLRVCSWQIAREHRSTSPEQSFPSKPERVLTMNHAHLDIRRHHYKMLERTALSYMNSIKGQGKVHYHYRGEYLKKKKNIYINKKPLQAIKFQIHQMTIKHTFRDAKHIYGCFMFY